MPEQHRAKIEKQLCESISQTFTYSETSDCVKRRSLLEMSLDEETNESRRRD